MKTIEEKIKAIIERAYRKGVLDGKEAMSSEGAKVFLGVSQVTAHEIFTSDVGIAGVITGIQQMRKSLTDAKLMLEHQQLEWTDTYKEIKAVLQNEPVENTDKILDGSLTSDDSRDVIVQQWLRLTEELFKKIK